jgi:hypothetical protein
MRKEDLIAELQKINGNPVISIGINESWGKISYPVISVTPLYAHDGHKVDSEPSIFEITTEDKRRMSPEQLAEFKRNRLTDKYGQLAACSIDERFWAVNGPWLDKWNREKIEMLEQKIANLERGNKNGNFENRQQVSNQED